MFDPVIKKIKTIKETFKQGGKGTLFQKVLMLECLAVLISFEKTLACYCVGLGGYGPKSLVDAEGKVIQRF